MVKKYNYGACKANHSYIVELAKTKKVKDISDILGINNVTLREYCKKNAITYRDGHEPPTGFVDDIVNLHSKGASVNEIAEHLGCSNTTVKTYLNNIYPVKGIPQYLKEEAKSMALAGIDLDYISCKFEIRRKDLSAYLKEENIDFYSTINMDNADKRFYVYFHRDAQSNVVYVGSGTGKRYKAKSGRSQKHLSIFDTLTLDIIKFGMTKQEAMQLEQEMILTHISDYLLNGPMKVSTIRDMDFEFFDKHLFYDETSETFLRWKTGTTTLRKSRVKYGDKAGGLDGGGYSVVSIAGKSYRIHRVVYLLNHYSISPDMIVDHIDGNKLNNQISNLRLVTAHGNNKNRVIGKRNTSGVNGVSWNSSNNCWVATWTENGKMCTASVNPTTRFPDEDGETAKQSAFDLAVFHRKLAEEMFYDKELEWHIPQHQNQ